MAKIDNVSKGKYGERLAVDYLKKLKYKIIKVNYSNKIGEIDIIAKQKDIIVFVEVKYRESANFGMPREAVNFYKQRKIKTVAMSYLKMNGLLESRIRFDVIEILGQCVTHLENCFQNDL